MDWYGPNLKSYLWLCFHMVLEKCVVHFEIWLSEKIFFPIFSIKKILNTLYYYLYKCSRRVHNIFMQI